MSISLFCLFTLTSFAQLCHQAQEVVLSGETSRIALKSPSLKVIPPSLTGCGDQQHHYARWYHIKNTQAIPLQVNLTYFPPSNAHFVSSCSFEKCLLNSKDETNFITIEPHSSIYAAYFTSVPFTTSTLFVHSMRVSSLIIPHRNNDNAQHVVGPTIKKISKIPDNVQCERECKIQIPNQPNQIKIGSCDNKINQLSVSCSGKQQPLTYSMCSDGHLTGILDKKSKQCVVSISVDSPTTIPLTLFAQHKKTKIKTKYFDETIIVPKEGGTKTKQYSIKAKKGDKVQITTFNEHGKRIIPIVKKQNSQRMQCGSNGVCTMYEPKKDKENVDVGIPVGKGFGKTRVIIAISKRPKNFQNIHQIPSFIMRNRLQLPFFLRFNPSFHQFTSIQKESPLDFPLPPFSFFQHLLDLDSPTQTTKKHNNRKNGKYATAPHNSYDEIKQSLIANEYNEGGSRQYVLLSIGCVIFILVTAIIAFIFQPNSLYRLFN
ncbi:Uncharacterized protein QTN25_000296 [Entamoeba marina]